MKRFASAFSTPLTFVVTLVASGIFLFHVQIASAQTTALGTLAASMQPGEWHQLTTTGFTQGLVEPCLDGANVFEYADSATWDPISRQWLFLGSTHGNCLLAKFVVYNDTNNTWRSEPLPPDPEIKGPFHAYHDNTINPNTGDLYYRHATQMRFWKYSTNGSHTWSELPSIPAPRGVLGCCSALEFFPERNGVLYVDGTEGIFWFNAGTNTWQRIANTALNMDSNVPTYAMGTYENIAEYNPVHHVIIFGGGREQPRTFYKMDSSGVITQMANAPADVFAGTIASLSTVDPVSGNYLAFLPAGAFYEYNVATDTWQQMPGTHPLKDGSGNYFEVAESPVSNYGVNMFVMHNPRTVWLYKHSSGGAPPPPDTTPPSVSISAPASGSTVSGTIAISANASDNIGVAGVQFKLDGNNLGVEDTSSPYSTSWDTTTAINGSHTLTAIARDAAGNQTTSAAVPATVSNSNPPPPPPDPGDFLTLCSQPGVLKCVGFDSAADLAGTYGDNSGVLPGDSVPQIDVTVKSSGTGSMKFTVPPNSSANSSGSYFTNFSNNLSSQFGENSEFYVQWRQRFSPEFLSTPYSGGGGWKQAILTTGDKPGCSSSNNTNCYASCTALGIITQNNYYRGFAQMYQSCTGSTSHGAYDPFELPFGNDYKEQNARPAPYCLYSQGQTNPPSYFPPSGNCFGYFPNEWMTFQLHVRTGPRVNDEFTNSYIQLSIARQGQPGQLVFDWGPYNLSASNLAANEKYGKIWLLPYNTGKDPAVTYPTSYTWYDDLIISTQAISMGGTSDTTPPTVSISSPASGATVSATTTVSATASDNVGVAGVQFKLDGGNLGAEDTTSPYSISWNTTTASNGSHSLTGVARDAAGNQTTSTAVTVTVSNTAPDTTPPTVSVTSPSGGATVSATITISATASDNVGVAGVQFKLDGSNLGTEDTSSPYSISWNTTTASNGSHSLTALTRDAAGNQTTSAAVTVTASNTPPTGLIGYWKFDETTGAVASDSSGAGNPGSLSNSPVWTSGQVGGALQFSATDNGNDNDDPRAVVGRNFDIAAVPFTLAAWINPTNFADYRAILSKRDSYSAADMRLDWGLNNSSGTVYLGRAGAQVNFTYAPPVNTWTHLTVVATSTDTRLYVNGVLQQTSAVFSLGTDGNANTVIGGTGEGTGGDNDPFKGMIDEVRAYNLALAATDVANVYNFTGADITPPAVSVTAPANGSTVSGSTTVSASASDNVGVVGVQFKLDGSNLGTEDTTSPYSISWDTTTASTGSHSLSAVARDAAGNQTTSAAVAVTVPDTTPPVSSITSPATGATVSATITVAATASDNVGVVGVQFKLDGANLGTEDTTSPYSISWDTTTASTGSHSLTAVARDAAGNQTTSSAVPVTVPDTTPPAAAITSPATGATVSAMITVSTTASDNVGVVGVQFKLDGANLGTEDMTSPYSTSMNTTMASNGSHTLTALARDAAGNQTTSSTVTVTVNNAPTAGLIGYWKFDEGTGVIASDSSGAGNPGSLSNSPGWTSGHGGGGLQFSATDNGNDNDDPRVVIGQNFDIAAVPFTLAAWVNPASFSDYRAIFSKRDSYSASGMRMDWGLNVSSGAVYLTRASAQLNFTYAPPVNTWTHLTVVATSTDTRLYVNGVLQQTLGVFTPGTKGTANTVIGGTGEGTGGDNDPFKGMIDEIRVYNQALTAADVVNVYNFQ